ncbi:N-acetyltransferase [Sporosarcina thermotolerans]|uniref:N-acetyltransferase n=1 Tax=Sporosarcina thermotolerans TaxID=633404 RepID=A0AAW9A9V1_9BACL|nr:N-acetyltransferase [Sporosarcina thermotolerans]MDW0115961.1 N-acetyltransferase [Sporosarcina thermotolerans]WHT46831.1 N-acetyltransferase [Sporosarcina thermotolerans]
MNIEIESPRNSKDLAIYLANMNTQTSQHVGYCGESKEEIYDTLTSDFSDLDLENSFMVAYEKEEIVGAIGLDIDLEDRSAEVWGPFLSEAYIHTALVNELWEKVTALSASQVDRYNFFLNRENAYAKEFSISHGGESTGQHTVLVAKKNEWGRVVDEGVIEYDSAYEEGFEELHGQAFPSTYYSAQTIFERLSEQNQLFIATCGDQLTGYVYIEADPLHGEGSIEYIAVSDQFRKRGIGKKLLSFAVNQLFAYEEIEEISLCVDNENENAIRLYQAAGFGVKHELIHLKIDKKVVVC